MNNQTTTSPLEAHRTPAVHLSHQSSLLDPIQRIWDAAGHANRATLLHIFNAPCDFAAMTWDELHYTVQIVLRAYMRRFIKSIQVPKC